MTPPYPPHLFSLYLAVSKRPTQNFRSDFGRGHAGLRYIDHTRIYTNTQTYTYILLRIRAYLHVNMK